MSEKITADKSKPTMVTAQSPCVRNCCLDESDTCLGCYRTLTEIINWQASPQSQKQEILAKCASRKKAATQSTNSL